MNLRKREREKKKKKRREETFSRPANFSRAFHFRVFPTLTIWEPGTGYYHVEKLVSEKILPKRRFRRFEKTIIMLSSILTPCGLFSVNSDRSSPWNSCQLFLVLFIYLFFFSSTYALKLWNCRIL